MDITELILLGVKAFVLANLVMVVFALMTWVERRLLAQFQFRHGPNRVGPAGLLQPIADLVKLIRKENFRPHTVQGWIYIGAPVLSLLFALMTFAVIPFGDGTVDIFGWETTPHMAADLPVAVLFAVAVAGLGGYGVILGGWATNSKYGLLGSMRAAAQLISYELALALAVLPVIMMSKSLSTVDIANGYRMWEIGGFSPWFVFWAPLSFVIFVIAALAEAHRPPFDFAEAEEEIVGGYHTEFGGLRYALFANAEYVHMIAISALGVTFFLGGWHGPGLESIGWGMGVIWFVLKLALFMFFFIWIRATVPRLRYDRLMQLGWKVMLPLATIQFLFIALLVSQGWGQCRADGAPVRCDEVQAQAAPADAIERSLDRMGISFTSDTTAEAGRTPWA